MARPYPSMAPTGYPTQQYHVGQYPMQGAVPVVQGSFDPGARFNAGATVNVPVSTTLKVKIFVQWPFGDQLFGFSRQGKFLGAKLY